jgi:tRNA (adenine37-N6)-methyltransferase
MKSIRYKPIGTIRTPFKDLAGMPIQPVGARHTRGTVEVDAPYRAGLKDLDGFSHVILLYHFHRSRGYDLRVTPFLDTNPRGLFATRAPKRPNPIGLSVVRLLGIRGRTVTVEGVDVADGTPLLDIKPYVPEFDHPGPTRIGWLKAVKAKAKSHRADNRFR